MKNIKLIFSIIALTIFVVDSLDAQRSRRSRDRNRTEQEDKLTFSERINYEIRVGNIAFGSGFGIDLKPSVGLKFNKFLTVGAGFRYDYEFINAPFGQEDLSLNSYGPFALLRAKVHNSFYLQGEYNLVSLDLVSTRETQGYPTIGGGYVQGGDNWKYNIELLFIADDFVRDINNSSIEFWFVFSKNF